MMAIPVAMFASISVSSPSDNGTVSSPARLVASATPTSSQYRISSMQIYVDDVRKYRTESNRIDTSLSLSSGTHEVILKAWDTSGAIQRRHLTVKVGSSGSGGLSVSSPANNTTVSSPVHFVVSASPTNSQYKISSVQIYVDDVRVYRTTSSKIDTHIGMKQGTRKVIVKAWDTSGALRRAYLTVNVGGNTSTSTSNTDTSTGSGSRTWYDIEEMDGWQSCSHCAGVGGDGPIAVYWMKKGIKSPSMDGHSREFFLGGSTPYANVLFSKRLSGDASFIRSKRKFLYDLYFYYTRAKAAQALEFDINQHIDGKSYIWGTQCNVRAGHVWDIWDNINKKWVSTGVYCGTPPTYKWNHVVLEMERTSDNKLRYVSITYNGKKHYLNRYYRPSSNSWVGLTMNYQMDGNVRQEDYHTWVDNFKFTTW
jgi:hypothetical protein